MFDIIAVPVDGSEYGYKAADVAIEIAKKFDSKIAAIHVLEEFSFSNNDEGIDTVEHLLTADALRDMKFIINQAHADLVVIHALGSDDKRFVSFEENEVSQNQIGSVSERLLRTSDVPVVLVR